MFLCKKKRQLVIAIVLQLQLFHLTIAMHDTR